MTDDLAIHVIEISKFERELKDLKEPLDFWLYFFKNGIELDTDALPEPLGTGDIHEAMEVLKMFSQDEMERELYEGRLKAKRDKATAEARYSERRREVEVAQKNLAEGLESLAEAERQVAESERQAAESEQRLGGMTRERDQAIRVASKLALMGQIQLCERLLGRNVTDSAGLQQRDENALRELANRLERELTPSR